MTTTSMTLQWHKECYANWLATYRKDVKELERLQAQLITSRKNLDFYLYQITEAEKQGKVTFDSERFLIKRTDNK